MEWEKAEKTERKQEKKELYPQPAPTSYKGKKNPEQLLWVQILLCAAMAAFLLFSKSTSAPYWPDLQGEYQSVLENGISFSSDTTFSHFADQTIAKLRRKEQEILNQLDGDMLTGRGGIWKVSAAKKTPPAGASLESYTVQFPFQMPVEGRLTSEYGFRDNPVNGEEDFHAGLDIAAEEGTAVLCVSDGQVMRTGYNAERGNYVIVRHAEGVQTLYQHMSCVFVRGGETVSISQRLGTVGSTGYSTGPHLHFELIVNGIRMDPSTNFPELFA